MRFVVQHVRGIREETIRELRLLPNVTVVECDGYPQETFIRTLVKEAHWHLEDDAVLAPDFIERVVALEERFPTTLVNGFATRPRSGWRPASSFLYNLCFFLPEGWGEEVASFARSWGGWERDPDGFDYVIRDWLKLKKYRYWQESPSLVQHYFGRSLLGPRSKYRTSPTWDLAYLQPVAEQEPSDNEGSGE